MSLANLVVQPDCAYLLTDSGYFAADGRILKLGPKSIEFREQSICIAAVGAGFALGRLATESIRQGLDDYSQTEFLARLIGVTQSAYRIHGMDPDREWARFLIAFYSHKSGRALGMAFHTSVNAGDKAPWTYHPAPVILMPNVSRTEVEGAGCGPGSRNLSDPRCFDPYRDFMPIVEAQRRSRNWAHTGDGCFIAGDIVLSAVSGTGISHTVLHSYPDREGERAGLVE